MVSLDQQIQKDRQKHKSQHSGKKAPFKSQSSRPSDNRTKKFNPSNKQHAIKKDNNRPRFTREDRQRRGGGVKRVDRVRAIGGETQRSGAPQHPAGRTRISRAPKKTLYVPKKEPQVASEQAQQKGRTLKVMGLHPDFTNEDLYKLFSTEGALQKCLIEQDNFGRSLTTAIVKYHNASSATSAIANLNQHKVMNSILTVEPYKNIKR